LERDGRVQVVGVEAGAGPDRKRYAITAEGVTDLDAWLAEPEEPQPQLQSVLFTKVMLALMSGRPAGEYLVGHELRKSYGLTPALRGASLLHPRPAPCSASPPATTPSVSSSDVSRSNLMIPGRRPT
jgi:hypothetical protein